MKAALTLLVFAPLLVACGGPAADGTDSQNTREVSSVDLVQVQVEAARARLDTDARSRAEDVLADLDVLCAREFERFDAYQRLHSRLAEVVGRIDSPPVLAALFWECECRRDGRPGQRLSDNNVHMVAQGSILRRLGELATAESAAALVGLFGHEAAHFDGEGALIVGEAITTCGEPCLPHLKLLVQADGSRAGFAGELAGMIRKGEIFGP